MTEDAQPAETAQKVAEDFAAFWWAQNSGEAEAWDGLDADEREAVVENSNAEAVADWFAERMADMDWYVGKVPGFYAVESALATDAAKESDRG